MGRALLVTGTDTGVGKTFVAVLLLRWLREEGMRAAALKPVETGCPAGPGGAPRPEDAAALRDAASPGEPLSRVCLYALATPLSPHLAAEREGVRIDPARIGEAVADARARADAVVVEGAGGIAVEIVPGYTFADLARELGLPALVVAENRLGVLNHLRLTLSFLETAGVPLLGVVLNDRRRDASPACLTNGAEAARMAKEAYLGRIPHGAPALPDEAAAAFRRRFLARPSARI